MIFCFGFPITETHFGILIQKTLFLTEFLDNFGISKNIGCKKKECKVLEEIPKKR